MFEWALEGQWRQAPPVHGCTRAALPGNTREVIPLLGCLPGPWGEGKAARIMVPFPLKRLPVGSASSWTPIFAELLPCSAALTSLQLSLENTSSAVHYWFKKLHLRLSKLGLREASDSEGVIQHLI